ncbi:MAG: exo-alpha-sialidase [Kofleriaceae bacterium]|nr:exo-alpha-sialidase [Kofleriaceae bacterium]
MKQTWIAVMVVVVAGCSSPAKKSSNEPAGGGASGAGSGSATSQVTKAARGAACEPSESDPQGSCGDGMFCMPMFPGGYCMSFCGGAGTACGDGVCAESPRAGEVCLAGCASDADCRGDEGYVCDPTWKACTMPEMLGPKIAACDEPARKRGIFDAAEEVSTAAGPGLYHHEIAAGLLPNGAIVGLYIAGGAMGAPNSLGMVRVAADGTLIEGDREFKTARENHFDPWVAVDKKGVVHAVWLGFDGGHAPEKNMEIGYARSADGGKTWTEPRPIQAVADCPAGTDGCMDKPMIAIGPDPKKKGKQIIYVSYYSEPAEGMRLVTSRDGGDTFSETSVAVLPGAYGDLEVDSKGVVHAVAVVSSPAHAFGSPDGTIQYTRSTDGGATFSEPVTVSASAEDIPFYFVNPTLGIDAKGKRVDIAYASGGPDLKWNIALVSSKDGKKWSRMLVDAGSACNHSVPNLAEDASGKVHLTWAESRGGGAIAHTTCTTSKCAAPDLVSSQPFARYSFARHAAVWTGEYATLLVDAKHKRIHALWSQVVDEDGKAVARIFHAAGKLSK